MLNEFESAWEATLTPLLHQMTLVTTPKPCEIPTWPFGSVWAIEEFWAWTASQSRLAWITAAQLSSHCSPVIWNQEIMSPVLLMFQVIVVPAVILVPVFGSVPSALRFPVTALLVTVLVES